VKLKELELTFEEEEAIEAWSESASVVAPAPGPSLVRPSYLEDLRDLDPPVLASSVLAPTDLAITDLVPTNLNPISLSTEAKHNASPPPPEPPEPVAGKQFYPLLDTTPPVTYEQQ